MVPVHMISLLTWYPISLCAAANVLIDSVLPHPLGPVIQTYNSVKLDKITKSDGMDRKERREVN